MSFGGIHALVIFLVLVVLGEPLFLIIAALALFCFVFLDPTNPSAVLDKMSSVVQSFTTLSTVEPLIAIPLFTLAGTIMTHGGISGRLVAFARALTGWFPGGLGWACVAACTIFAAISGSSAVTIIAIGGLIYPTLRREKFSESFSLGLITSCGAIGILIPPSLPLIVYGIVAGNAAGAHKPKIEDLFRAGLVPSALCVGALCLYATLVAVRRRIPAEPFSPADLLRKFGRGFFALLLIVILLVGIYGGYTTATEASAVACLYAIVVEVFIHREIGARDLLKIGREAIVLNGVILMVLVAAGAFTEYIKYQQIPDRAIARMQFDRFVVRAALFSDAEFEVVRQPVYVADESAALGVTLQPFDASKAPRTYAKAEIGKLEPVERTIVGRAREDGGNFFVDVKDSSDWDDVKTVFVPQVAVLEHTRPLVHSRLGFLIVVNILLLVVGSIMDIYSGIVVIAPLIVPMAIAYEVNLVHLGIIFVLNLELGLAHPPLGINLFIAQSYFRKSIGQVTLAAIPFLLLLLGVLAAVTYWEPLSLWLVQNSLATPFLRARDWVTEHWRALPQFARIAIDAGAAGAAAGLAVWLFYRIKARRA